LPFKIIRLYSVIIGRINSKPEKKVKNN